LIAKKIVKKSNEIALSYRDHFVFPVAFSLTYDRKENILSISDTIANRNILLTDESESMQKFFKVFEALVTATRYPELSHDDENDVDNDNDDNID
jgi:hypothetical protein